MGNGRVGVRGVVCVSVTVTVTVSVSVSAARSLYIETGIETAVKTIQTIETVD